MVRRKIRKRDVDFVPDGRNDRHPGLHNRTHHRFLVERPEVPPILRHARRSDIHLRHLIHA